MKRLIILTSTAIVPMAVQAHAQTSAPPTNPRGMTLNAAPRPPATHSNDMATPSVGPTHASSKVTHHRRKTGQRRKLYRHL
ncbi:hypothetical protein B0G81_7778 [Paraburkholderia sp. BL6665CI2N2]|nr:hypothetical protein B0G81_7778 [Paraburkholderia sp. BL6665CI2N2]